ncbi:MAG: hypothetical protein ACRCSV_04425 [Chlamydiales bacterium]
MTINAINNENNYPDSIKSYVVDTVRQSVFNSPIVKTAFVASTVLATGIAAAYLVKKTKEAIRVVIDRPLQTACLTAAVFATGTVIVYYPVESMITFVAISYILLNRNLYTKIHDTHQMVLSFFDSPFKAIGNLTGGPNNSKNNINWNDNQSLLGITKAVEQLNLDDLKLGSIASLEDEIISSDTALPMATIEQAEELHLENTTLESTESLKDEIIPSATAKATIEQNQIIPSVTVLPMATIEQAEELHLENTTLESTESLEDEIIPSATVLPMATIEQAEELHLENTTLESTESLDDKSSNIDQSLLGIAKTIKQFNFEDLKLVNPKPLEDNVNANNNPSPLGITKAVEEFNLQDLKLGSRDTLESSTGSIKPFLFPTPIKNIYPNSNPTGAWPTKPFKVIKTVKNPAPNGGLLPKSYGNLLKLVRIIPK